MERWKSISFQHIPSIRNPRWYIYLTLTRRKGYDAPVFVLCSNCLLEPRQIHHNTSISRIIFLPSPYHIKKLLCMRSCKPCCKHRFHYKQNRKFWRCSSIHLLQIKKKDNHQVPLPSHCLLRILFLFLFPPPGIWQGCLDILFPTRQRMDGSR